MASCDIAQTSRTVKLILEIDGVETFRFDGDVNGMVEVHRREHDYLIRIEQPQAKLEPTGFGLAEHLL